jgi:hypothetical protein
MNIAFYIARSDWMEQSFVHGAREAGAGVFVYTCTAPWSRVPFNQITSNLAVDEAVGFALEVERLHKEQGIDLVFCCVSDDNMTPAALKAIRKLGIPLVNFHPDMGFLWFRILRTGHLYDLVACAQSCHISALKRNGINACWLPFAGNLSASVQQPVSFNGLRYLGSPFADRSSTLGYLFRAGLPVEIWGHNWDWFQRVNPPQAKLNIQQSGFRLPHVSEKQWIDVRHYLFPRLAEEPRFMFERIWKHLYYKMFPEPFDAEAFYGHLPVDLIKGRYAREDFEGLVQTAQMNLGFSHMHAKRHYKTAGRQMRLRDIEIPMAGGFYLAEYSEDLLQCFTPGVHLETWENKDELLEKAHYYLHNPEKASRMAKAGQQHALAHHTWGDRYNQIFALLGLSKKFTIPSDRDKPYF